LANLPDGTPDAVVGIQENALSPNSGDNFLTSDNFARVLKQQEKNFKRNPLQLHYMSSAAQPAWTKIKREIFAE
jgi:hypothetical protein